MQTLGKVVRRNQAPASATGLSANSGDGNSESIISSSVSSSSDQPQKQSGTEASSSLSNSNTVPGSLTGSSVSSSSTSGWAAVPSSDVTAPAGPASQTAGQDAASCPSKPGSGSRQPSAASTGSGSAPQSTPWTAGGPAAASSAASGGQAPDRIFSDQMRGKPSLLPAQEFPELGVEEVPAARQADMRQQPLLDPGPYGPGPSLRPAIGANWSHGSANVPGSGPGGGGVNGSQPADRIPQQTPATGSQPFGGPANTGSGVAGYRPPGGQSVQRNAFPGAGGNLPPGSAPDFRGNRYVVVLVAKRQVRAR